MGIDMYLSSSQSQATSVSSMSKQHSNGYEKLQTSLQNFSGDTVLKGSSYDSAKAFYSAVLSPLSQGGLLLTEAVDEACKKFPEQYTSEVDSSDLKSDELEAEIEKLEENISRARSIQQELLQYPVPHAAKKAMMDQQRNSITRDFESKKKLEEKLEKLKSFDKSSPAIFAEISSLSESVKQGTAQANQSWNAKTGQFTIPSGKNMEWATTITAQWNARAKKLEEEHAEKFKQGMKGRVYVRVQIAPGVYEWMWVKDPLKVSQADFKFNEKFKDYLDILMNPKENGILDDYFATMAEELRTGINAKTGKPLTDLEKAQRWSTVLSAISVVAIGAYYGGKGLTSNNKKTPKKASGAEPIKQPNDFATEIFLPKEYYKNNYSSMDGVPNSRMEYNRLASSGNVEKSVIIYDKQGKQSIRIDYSDHGNSLHHTNPHIHEFEWENGYKHPSSHTKYFLDDNGVLRPGRIDQGTNSITFDFDK